MLIVKTMGRKRSPLMTTRLSIFSDDTKNKKLALYLVKALALLYFGATEGDREIQRNPGKCSTISNDLSLRDPSIV